MWFVPAEKKWISSVNGEGVGISGYNRFGGWIWGENKRRLGHDSGVGGRADRVTRIVTSLYIPTLHQIATAKSATKSPSSSMDRR